MASDAIRLTANESETHVVSTVHPMRSFNFWSLIVVGLFFLLVPWPLVELGWAIAGMVMIHAALFVGWYVGRDSQRSFLLSVLTAGVLVYGFSWLLIATQARGTIQNLFLNPWFLAPQWKELWAPVCCFGGFAVASLALSIVVAVTRFNKTICLSLLTVVAIGSFALLLNYLPNLQLRLASRSPRQFETAPLEHGPLDYKEKEKLDARAYELFRWSCVADAVPSESWCRQLTAFRQDEEAAFAINRLMSQEPLFRQAIDGYLAARYGLDPEIDAKLAWETLESLANESMNVSTWKVQSRAVELVSPHIDHQQLIDKLVEADTQSWPSMSLSGNELQFKWRARPANNQLKPFIYAAWYLDLQENTGSPDQYSSFEKAVGRKRFRDNPPGPVAGWTRSMMRQFRDADEGGVMGFFTSMSGLEEVKPSLCAGYEYDELLRRRLLWSQGSEMKFGSTTIKQSEHAMLYLDSKGGRAWRQTNRDRLLELAQKSIAPVPKAMKKEKNRDVGIAMGAVASVLNQGAPQKAWSTPPHLEFLFLDRVSESRPSIAFEFWPELDARLDKVDKLADEYKLVLRWNYLARVWPESTTKMFVDSYMNASNQSRQRFLLGESLNHVGLPRTMEPAAQLEILEAIREKLVANPGSIGEGIYVLHSSKTDDELESVDLAIAGVDCREGAEKYVDWLARVRKDPADLPDGFEGYQRLGFLLAERDHKYTMHKGQRWFDDRLEVLSQHNNPQLRLLAARAIRVRPVPQYMPVLEELKQDANDEVRAQAIKVSAELDELRDR